MFLVNFPGSKKKTCSKECKNELASSITSEHFKNNPEAREHHRRKAIENSLPGSPVREKYEKGMANRRSYFGENHPTYGVERTPEWRENISKGNKGKTKGKTWEEIYGKEYADIKRKQTSDRMNKTNETLLYDRMSEYENAVFKYLAPLKFKHGMRIGKYTVDFLNEDTKTIIEFNGDFWHCNPKLYEADYYNPKTKMLAEDKWNADAKRQKDLEDIGYKVIVLWENDMINTNRTVNEDAIQSAIKDYRNKQ